MSDIVVLYYASWYIWGMTSSEFPENPALPEPERSIDTSDIVRFYSSDVEAGLREVNQQLATEGRTAYNHFTIGTILYDKIVIAAESGDTATIDDHIKTMVKLEEMPSHLFANACLAGIRAGSAYAGTRLREELAAYKGGFDPKKDVREDDSLAYPFTMHDILKNVVDGCHERDEDPTPWIDAYAINDVDNRSLYMRHYEYKVKDGDEAAQQALDAIIAEMAHGNILPPEFVLSFAAQCISKTADESIRSRYVSRMLTAAKRVFPTQSVVLDLINAGQAMMHTTYEPSHIEQLQELVDRLGEASNFTPFQLAKSQLAWRSEITRATVDRPEDVVTDLEQRIIALCNLASPIEPSDHFFAMGLKSNLLHMHADYCARKGDFASAKVFLEQLGGRMLLRDICYQQCLRSITTFEQLEELRPPNEKLAADKHLAMLFGLTEAGLANDYDRLANLAAELLREAQENKNIPLFALQPAYELVEKHAPDAAKRLLSDILSAIDAGKRVFTFSQHFKEQAVVAGVPGAAQRMCQNIENQRWIDPSYQLAEKWKLVKLISKAGQ